MKISKDSVEKHNEKYLKNDSTSFSILGEWLSGKGVDVQKTISDLAEFQVAIPSWALGTGGTRFGRFPKGGEPRNLMEKIEDVGLLHAINRSSGAISLHIPWDIPDDYEAVTGLAESLDIGFDAVNSNTFQDQPAQEHSYKFGSLSHTDPAVRKQAVDHNIEVIEYGGKINSKALTVWLADGSCFPGQQNFRKAYEYTLSSLQEIYDNMPGDWKLLLEYKPFEPNFYSMVIPDWGTSYSMVSQLGQNAHTLVDLGHHLPNTNIEQVVSTLLTLGRLGGFHFNDSKFSDDDLTVGSIKPFQLFLIFNELVYGQDNNKTGNPSISWMIDASHNVKDPLEDLLQSVEAIKSAYAKALLVDHKSLEEARKKNDVVGAEEILQDAFRTDVRPLLARARLNEGAAVRPIEFFRDFKVRDKLIEERGVKTMATGL
jgi:L-rhamnose isomerase / sugar isomerase